MEGMLDAPPVVPTSRAWPFERAGDVLESWRLARGSTVVRLLQYPPLPEIAESVRGTSLVVVESETRPFSFPLPTSGSSILVRELTAEAVERIVDLCGAHARSPFVSVEIRRRTNGHYAITVIGIPSDDEAASAIDTRLAQLFRALQP
jgi:hypothetical protein